MFIPITDVLCKGVWENLGEIQEPELQTLVASLESTVYASRAPSTASKYLYAFTRWKNWAHSHDGIVMFPAQEAEFALYLQHVEDNTASKSAVERLLMPLAGSNNWQVIHQCLSLN